MARERAAARVLADALGWPLLMLRAANLAGSELELSLDLKLAEREALLTGALLCWWEADRFTEPPPERTEEARLFVQALAHGQAPTALLTDKAWQPGPT